MDINAMMYLGVAGKRGDWVVMLVTAHGIAVMLGHPTHTKRAALRERTRIRRLLEKDVPMGALNQYLRSCQQIAANPEAPNPQTPAAAKPSDA
jgi:hypothetical protein